MVVGGAFLAGHVSRRPSLDGGQHPAAGDHLLGARREEHGEVTFELPRVRVDHGRGARPPPGADVASVHQLAGGQLRRDPGEPVEAERRDDQVQAPSGEQPAVKRTRRAEHEHVAGVGRRGLRFPLPVMQKCWDLPEHGVEVVVGEVVQVDPDLWAGGGARLRRPWRPGTTYWASTSSRGPPRRWSEAWRWHPETCPPWRPPRAEPTSARTMETQTSNVRVNPNTRMIL